MCVGRGGQVQCRQGDVFGVAQPPRDAWPGQAYVFNLLAPGPAAANSSSEANHAQQCWGAGRPHPHRSPRAWAYQSAKLLIWDTQHVMAVLNKTASSELMTPNQKGSEVNIRRKAPLHPSRCPPSTQLPLHTQRKQRILDTHEGDTPSCRGRNRCPLGSD